MKTPIVFEKGFSSTSFEKYLKALFAGGFCRQPPAPPPAADVFSAKFPVLMSANNEPYVICSPLKTDFA